MPQETLTPLSDRLNRIRALRDTPRPLYPIKPTPMAPFVRMARAGNLRPKTFVAGAFVPAGSDVTA